MTKSINIESLQSTKHMFEWLAEQPFETIINNIEGLLSEQVSGTQVTHFEAIGKPQW